MIGIWWVGASFERTQGTRRFLGVYLTAGVLANLAFGLVAHLGYVQAGGIFAGGSLAVLALFVAFGRIFGRTPMPIIGGLTLQARTIAMIYVAWSVVVCLSGSETGRARAGGHRRGDRGGLLRRRAWRASTESGTRSSCAVSAGATASSKAGRAARPRTT